jgi:hypothetical protein
MLTIHTDVANLNLDLGLYAQLARKSLQEAVIRKGVNVTIGGPGFEGWTQRLRRLAPAKGAIRAERISALEAGGGIKVRPSAYRSAQNKLGSRVNTFSDLTTRKIMRRLKGGSVVAARSAAGLNLQALAVKAELGMRERARGFSAVGVVMRSDGSSLMQMAASFPSGASSAARSNVFRGKVGQQLSRADIRVGGGGAVASLGLTFGSEQTKLGESLLKPRQQMALHGAIAATHADMMVYIRRKLGEAKGKARLR